MQLLSLFTLRLAAGMIACLLLLSPSQVNPRYFRTHFLIVFGVAGVALIFLPPIDNALTVKALLIAAMVAAFLGSVVFSLENAPGGLGFVAIVTVLLLTALLILGADVAPWSLGAYALIGDLTSAALLGTAMSAMLMGHLYLIAPTMALGPLYRLLTAAGVALLIRLVVDGFALGSWTDTHSFGNVGTDMKLWLPVRWLVGFGGPLVLGWMAWQTAKMRSTQSATGILYVVIILCFLGELTSLLLRAGGLTL